MSAPGAVVDERCLPVDLEDMPEPVIDQICKAGTEAEVLEIMTAHFPHGTESVRLRWTKAGEARIAELRAGVKR